MRILWFTNTASLYNKNSDYNGGGWIESLQKQMMQVDNINLAISFYYNEKIFKTNDAGVVYYPIYKSNTLISNILNLIPNKKREKFQINYYLKIIKDFKPDVIQIFGTERNFGLLALYTNIPIVLHVQGILNPYCNAWYPPNVSSKCLFFFWRYKFIFKLLEKYNFDYNSRREILIYKNLRNITGRTQWDKYISKLLSPNAKYFFSGEILRTSFYNSEKWQYSYTRSCVIMTISSAPLYKGFDLILKTASVLKSIAGFDFKWMVYGNINSKPYEKYYNIGCEDNNIILKGVVNDVSLAEAMLKSNIFVSCSYIDNSPNSVCEAQIIGLPVIATNVGGCSSLIEDKVDGLLVPSNDPYYLAAQIQHLYYDINLQRKISANSILTAEKRHNVNSIISQVLEIYKEIIK